MAPENSDKGGWRYFELGGGAWPPGSPSRPNLGLCFPWPCPSPPPCWKTGCLRQWGRRPKGVPLNVASQGTLPGPHLWGSSSGWGSGLVFVLLLALCTVSISLSLSPFPMSSVSFSWLCLPFLGPVFLPHHLSMSGWGWGSWFVHLWITLCFGLQFSCFWCGWGSSVSPADPPSRSQPYLAPGSPSHICLSPVSGSQNPRFTRTLRPQPMEDSAAPSPGGGGVERGAAPSPGPGPAVPLPTSPTL